MYERVINNNLMIAQRFNKKLVQVTLTTLTAKISY